MTIQRGSEILYQVNNLFLKKGLGFAIALSNDSNYAFVGNSLLDSTLSTCIKEFKNPIDDPQGFIYPNDAVRFSPDNKNVLTRTENKIVRLWNTNSDSIVQSLEIPLCIYEKAIEFTINGCSFFSGRI